MSLLMTVPATSAFLSRRGEGGLHPGTGSQITLQAGDNQSALAGTSVAIPPRILVRDQLGSAVSNVAVQFVPTGGSTASEVTSDGFTRANQNPLGGAWTQAPSFGSLQLINNTIQGALPATEGVAYYNGVTWPADQYSECQVVALGASGSRGGGPAVRISTTTQSAYIVQVQLTGTGVALCRYSGGAFSILQNINTTVGSTNTIRLEVRGTTLRVFNNGLQVGTDTQDGLLASGNAGIDVYSNTTFALDNWAGGIPATTGGTVSPDTPVVTDATGIAAPTFWTLGTTPGTNTITVALAGYQGSPVIFTATGTSGAGQATQMAINGGNNQTAIAGTNLASPPSVIIRDAGGAPVSGVLVTFALVSGGGSVTGASQTTNASGIATLGGWTLGAVAGTNTVTASSPGLTGSPLTFTATGAVPATFDFYVSPTGVGSGPGTIGAPWSLAYALAGAGGAVVAGKVVAIRGGTYTGPFTTSLNGTAANPIIFRAYPAERPILVSPYSNWTPYEQQEATLNVFGSYQWIWGLELTGAGMKQCLNNQGLNNKLINLVVHDGIIGLGFWNNGPGGELHGCLSYNHGPNQNGNGYAIYTQNNVGSTKVISDNIFFNSWNKTIHAWGGGYPTFQNEMSNMKFRGNITFGAGTIGNGVAGAQAFLVLGSNVDGLEVTDHYSYEPGAYCAFRTGDAPSNADIQMERCVWTRFCQFGVSGGAWTSAVVRNNTFYSAGNITGEDVLSTWPSTAGYQWSTNAHYRTASATAWRHNGTLQTFANWKTASGLGGTDTNPGTVPTGTQVFVRPNAYETGRGHVVVYNWDSAQTVNVDLSAILTAGQAFYVRNAQDFFGSDVTSGTYQGGTIGLPMAGVTSPAPLFNRSYTTAPMTGPIFQVFVVRLQGS